MVSPDVEALLEADKYEGMFAGNRIGGMPTLKLNIIGEELAFLERKSRPLPRSRLAPGPRVKPPLERATKEAADMRATMQKEMRETKRPGTSMGFVSRMRDTCSTEAALRRSGLDPDATRERLFGRSSRGNGRFDTTYRGSYLFFEGADEISLHATKKKQRAEMRAQSTEPVQQQPLIGMKHTDTAVVEDLKKRQEKFRNKRCNPFDKCPKWETTQTGNFKAWDFGQANHRRSKAQIALLNPLIAQ